MNGWHLLPNDVFDFAVLAGAFLSVLASIVAFKDRYTGFGWIFAAMTVLGVLLATSPDF